MFLQTWLYWSCQAVRYSCKNPKLFENYCREFAPKGVDSDAPEIRGLKKVRGMAHQWLNAYEVSDLSTHTDLIDKTAECLISLVDQIKHFKPEHLLISTSATFDGELYDTMDAMLWGNAGRAKVLKTSFTRFFKAFPSEAEHQRTFTSDYPGGCFGAYTPEEEAMLISAFRNRGLEVSATRIGYLDFPVCELKPLDIQLIKPIPSVTLNIYESWVG